MAGAVPSDQLELYSQCPMSRYGNSYDAIRDGAIVPFLIFDVQRDPSLRSLLSEFKSLWDRSIPKKTVLNQRVNRS